MNPTIKQYVAAVLAAPMLAALMLAACGGDAPQQGADARDAGADAAADAGADTRQPSDADADADAERADTGDADAGEPAIFASIDTTGAELSGTIPAAGELRVELAAAADDRVVIWLRKAAGSDWNPSLALVDAATETPLQWANPTGNADARIPFEDAQLDTGFVFADGGDYLLRLMNLGGQASGPFELVLECVGGPCSIGTPPDNPYEGLSGAELLQMMRDEHNAHHQAVSYDDARQAIFSTIDNHGGLVECVYTGTTVETTTYSNTDFNTEHSWPQSRGAGDGAPRSDIHHLFPTTADSNRTRSAYHFGVVVRNVSWSEGGSKLGEDASGQVRFEPRDAHKGNVARALFYFSAVYDQPIEAFEEDVLRDWHALDPVDDRERQRNVAVERVQGSRNPFVDFPDLPADIADF